MSTKTDTITVRKAKLTDINQMYNFYFGIPSHIRRLFHPFPYVREKVFFIFFVIILSGMIINITKRLPKLGSLILVAEDTKNSKFIGLIVLSIIDKEPGGLVANCGPVTEEGHEGRGIGTKMYYAVMEHAKEIGIKKFRVTVLEDNKISLAFHKKMGYVIKGHASDDYWNGKYEKNLLLELELKE